MEKSYDVGAVKIERRSREKSIGKAKEEEKEEQKQSQDGMIKLVLKCRIPNS